MNVDIGRFAVALVALLVVVSGCSAGDDRPLKYLQSLPEDVLAYPGSTLTCNVGSPENPGIDDPGWATSTHCYSAAASESTVVAWYAEALASRGWRRLDQHCSHGGTMPEWRKEFVALQMKRVDIADDEDPNPFVFTVALLATGSTFDPAPIPGLLALPESNLTYPGSDDRGVLTLGRSLSSNSAKPATVQRMAETPASVTEVEQYFDREFLARGWRAVTSPPTDMRFGWNPTLAWQTGDVMAGLHATRIRSGTITSYRFAIAEVLGPEQTPGSSLGVGGCEAKASLSSTRSRSSAVKPARVIRSHSRVIACSPPATWIADCSANPQSARCDRPETRRKE